MSITDSFLKAHSAFLGTTPTPKQDRLYRSFPEYHGFSSQELDVETFEAVLILALVQTYPRNLRPDPFKTYLFVRGAHNTWAMAELGKAARRMFDHLKESNSVRLAKHLGTFFHAVSMGSRVLHFPESPDRWAAFGFDKNDPVPDWMRVALLESETT